MNDTRDSTDFVGDGGLNRLPEQPENPSSHTFV